MATFETQNAFRKLQLDTSHTHHTGSSSLSLSLCNQESRSQSPNAATPISIRLSQPRTFDTYPQQCTESPELSSSGRYAQSRFTLSPLERAARADNSTLFQPLVTGENDKRDHQKKAVLPVSFQEPGIPHATSNAQDAGFFFGKKSLPVRSNTESERYNYDLSSGRRRDATSAIVDSFIRETGTAQDDQGDDYESRPSYRAIEPSSLMSQPRRRFLSPSPFVSLLEDQDRMSSLTSDSTVGSPLSEALATPTDSECSDVYGHPLMRTTRCQSFLDPISLDETSSWHKDLHRNKSYNFDILPPVGMGSRRKRRAFSEKRLSPANQFLSGWSLQKAPEPDDEGQEVGAYVIGKQIGFGGFSVVKEVTTMVNGVKIKRAVKIVRKQAHSTENENDRIQAEFDHEVSIWRYLNHHSILPLIEVYDTPHATFCFTKLVTNGTLWDLLKQNRQGLPAQTARKYACQLASAIRYLHEDVRIIHSDVKLENCLIDVSADGEGNLLLCDFGMAEQMLGSTDDDDDLETACSYGSKIRRRNATTDVKGSLQYSSPEMMAISAPPLSPAVDMWAYGVVVYALHVGELPFNHSFQPKLQMMIAKGDWDIKRFRNAKPFICDPENGSMSLTVVKGCLCKNVERRWSIGTVLNSEWLREFVEDSP